MSKPAIITVAREFYNNIFKPHIYFDAFDVEAESQAINKISSMKNRLNLLSMNYPANQPSENEKSFIPVMYMRGPQLIEAIENFDTINKYCHPDDCREEEVQIEALLKTNIAQAQQGNY